MATDTIWKARINFVGLSDTESVVFIENVSVKIGESPLVFNTLTVHSPYSVLDIHNVGVDLTDAINLATSEPSDEHDEDVVTARGALNAIGRDMASFVETVAKGVKAIILLGGFTPWATSSTSTGIPLKSDNAKFSNNGHNEQLDYSNKAVKNAKGNILFSSTKLSAFNFTSIGDDQMKIICPDGSILYVNPFTGHTATVFCAETGKLSGKSYSFNGSGISPGSDVPPTTIP